MLFPRAVRFAPVRSTRPHPPPMFFFFFFSQSNQPDLVFLFREYRLPSYLYQPRLTFHSLLLVALSLSFLFYPLICKPRHFFSIHRGTCALFFLPTHPHLGQKRVRQRAATSSQLPLLHETTRLTSARQRGGYSPPSIHLPTRMCTAAWCADTFE